LSAEKALQMCNMTVKQSQSPMWRDERRTRLTASKAHKIYRARSDVKRVEYFLDMKSLEGIAGVQYGLEMEPKAREKFVELTGFRVVETGLVVKQNLCWLAASPDGLFLDERDRLMVLEIKCPSSCEDKPINVEYIKDGELKKSHAYYTQIQLTMFVCNAEEAAFFVYSSVDQKCLRVPFDQEFV
jgi:putative phage-type endonuclease